MKIRIIHWILALAVVSSLTAAPLELHRTPILTANLAVDSTWQVETLRFGSWISTGVLVPGADTPSTIRLDGMSPNAAYRYVKINAVEGSLFDRPVQPTVTFGRHLKGSAPGVPIIRIDSLVDPNPTAWTSSSFSFPDPDGSYLRIVRPSVYQRGFFRAVEPDNPPGFAHVRSYAANPDSGYAGFGWVSDDMPLIYQQGYIAAASEELYNRDGQNAAGAGECYELVGSFGPTTVIVGDLADEPLPGTPGEDFLIGNPASQEVSNSLSSSTVSYRPVPAPVTGPVKVFVRYNIGSANSIVHLIPYNYRAAVSKLEIRSAGTANWIDLPRTVSNQFIYDLELGGTALVFPVDVRVTSRFGEVVTFPPIAEMNVNDRFSANGQFETFPDFDIQRVWTLPPIYTDSLGSTPGDHWSIVPWNGTSINPDYTQFSYEGSASLRINFTEPGSGLNLIHREFARPEFGVLQFAIRAISTIPVGGIHFVLTGYDATGASARASVVELPALDSSWQVLRIPLEAAAAPVKIDGFQILNRSGESKVDFLIDSMSIIQK